MDLSVFMREYLGWPTKTVAGGCLFTLLIIGMDGPFLDWSLSQTVLFILLTIEAWLLPYLLLPAAFLLAEMLPWNKNMAPLRQGEGMVGLVIGIFAYAFVFGFGCYVGFFAVEPQDALIVQYLKAMATGALIPLWFLVPLTMMLCFSGEPER